MRGALPPIVLALGLCLLPLARPANAQPGPHPEPERVRAELETVYRRLERGADPYFGARALARLESRLGARIAARVRTGGGVRTVHAVVGSGGSFGGSSLVQTIGLGDAEDLLSVAVAWPGAGTRQRFEGLPLGRYYRIEESRGAVPSPGSHRDTDRGEDQ